MTKRKTTQKPAPTINSTAPKQAVESDKAESKAKVASKPKKAPSKPRARIKKVVQLQGIVEPQDVKITISPPAPVSKAIDVDSRTITYASAGNAVPSKYEQFKAWLVFKLYVVTSYFRGY